MADEERPVEPANDASEAERAELRRQIDALMAQPPKEWPSVIVVGDENVAAIYPPPKRSA